MKRSRKQDEEKPIVHLTRACNGVSWDLWNTHDGPLSLSKDQILKGRALASHMNSLISVKVVALRAFSIRSQQSVCCSLGRDIVFDVIPQAALTKELTALVLTQGIAPGRYLRLGFVDPEDPELSLGMRTHELFGASVAEMMDRRYDIKHHWPLFSHALTLYYESSSAGDLPREQEIIESGGLLDHSSQQHLKLHNVQLEGEDHSRYCQWMYSSQPALRVPRVCSNAIHVVQEETEDEIDIETTDSSDGTITHQEFAEDWCSYGHYNFGESCPEPDPVVQKIFEFNSAPSVLTDTQMGAEYSVKLVGDVDFDYLISYCTKADVMGKGGLPHRSSWGSVNPVLLMNDSCLVQEKKPTYVITSRANLSQVNSDKELCYNEVFLPGRPVSRLNLDIDLKCCAVHHKHLSVNGDEQSTFKLGRLIAISLISAITDVLNSMRSSLHSPLHYEDVGKVAVYVRKSNKLKLSLRMLWYLPVELCSLSGINAYHSLVKKLACRSLCYELLSYPITNNPMLSMCSMCNIVQTRATVRKTDFGSKSLLISSPKMNRESAVDVGPYSTRKCVRLPNCHKREVHGTGAFKYIATFNKKYPEMHSEGPDAVSVGLSSNRILPDVTSLGPGFDNVICGSEGAPARLSAGAQNSEQVCKAQTALEKQWGVPTRVSKLKSGLSIVRAKHNSKHKCPVHNKVHTSAPLGAFVMHDGLLKYHCFVKKYCN